MRDGKAIGQKLTEFGLRPALDEELGDEVKVGARIDSVGNAGGDDGEDVRRALAADVSPPPAARIDHANSAQS